MAKPHGQMRYSQEEVPTVGSDRPLTLKRLFRSGQD